MDTQPPFAKELAALEKGWREAGINRLVNAEQKSSVRKLMLESPAHKLAQLPSHLRVEQEAFSSGMIQEAGSLKLMNDPLAYSAQLKKQIRLINEAFAEFFVVARHEDRTPEVLCEIWIKQLNSWVNFGYCEEIARDQDIDRMGEIIEFPSVRARFAVPWLATLTMVRCVFQAESAPSNSPGEIQP